MFKVGFSKEKQVFAAFSGKPPRIFFRLLNGRKEAWGKAARAARQDVLDTLARVGLTLNLVERVLRNGRNPYHYQTGELVERH